MSTALTPSDLVRLVPTQYEKARESGDLLFFPSTVEKHPELGVEFELRLCPALQKKPSQPPSTGVDNAAGDGASATSGNKGTVFDPFAPPYNANLFVGELRDELDGEEYVVLLNKYSVVPDHFLLVTKELVLAYSILVAAKKAGRNFLAFYNCGENSGASQPHKHLQFVPVDADGPPVEKLAQRTNLESPDKPFTVAALPYANHVYRLGRDLASASPQDLEHTLSRAFLSLLDLVVSTIRHEPGYPAGKPSYNVLITLEHLHVIPRRFENHVLKTGEKLNVNSLGFGGMLLVKSEEEAEAVKKEEIGKILRSVGLESVHEIQVAGESDDAHMIRD
ncbi:hypothetical protein ONZ45_g8050 [Pleurotus djamor]|nr:hypothetical protein ONZ45_g8050 [Pleurotus djamor]